MGKAQSKSKDPIKSRLNSKGVITGIVSLLIGLIIWFVIIPKTILIKGQAPEHFYWNPQFLPRLWTLIIILCSLGIIYEELFKVPDEAVEIIEKPNLWEYFKENYQPLVMLIIMISFVYLVPLIGYLPTIALVFLATLLCYGYFNIRNIIILMLIVPITLNYFFVNILNVYF